MVAKSPRNTPERIGFDPDDTTGQGYVAGQGITITDDRVFEVSHARITEIDDDDTATIKGPGARELASRLNEILEHGWDPNTNTIIFVDAPKAETRSGNMILDELLSDWLESFLPKNADYGDNAFELGAAGQFSDIWRKIGKLRSALWEGKELIGEQPEEIIHDLISHCFLTLVCMREGKMR